MQVQCSGQNADCLSAASFCILAKRNVAFKQQLVSLDFLFRFASRQNEKPLRLEQKK
jgi:hypothetical protein